MKQFLKDYWFDILFLIVIIICTGLILHAMPNMEIYGTEIIETKVEITSETELFKQYSGFAEVIDNAEISTEVDELLSIVDKPTKRNVTDEEYQLLLRVCMSECGGKWGEPLEGKVAVVETVLNRVDLGYGTITEVITQPYQYSMANNGKPDETVIEAVEMALSGDMYPDDMLYFRTACYHDFGIPYKQIGAHYFSLKE